MRFRFVCLWLLLAGSIRAQDAPPPPASQAAGPPINRHLALSSWPIYHANTYATASVMSTAAVDPTAFEAVDNLSHRRFMKGQVSPWTVLRPPGADGTQGILTSPINGVAKYIVMHGRLRRVDFLRLERRWTDFDWGLLLLADGSALVIERMHNRFAVVGDNDSAPDSPLGVRRRLAVDRERYGSLTSHFTLAFDGTVIALTDKPSLIAVRTQDGRVLADLPLPGDCGEVMHNSFPVDESGRAYLVGQRAMIAVDWDGRAFKTAWVVPYNMRGPGFEGTRKDRPRLAEAVAVARGLPGTGSGTTPTLIGDPKRGVVVVVDGHFPRNHLVAFWRGDLPDDWAPLPDPAKAGSTLDRRVAGVLALPCCTPEGDGYTCENSPAALGHALVVAQWAGFAPGPRPPKGVQRVDWNPAARRLELVWVNPDVHINGVPTIGRGPESPCVFGMGREGADYVYSVLDLRNGNRVRRIDLGQSDDVLDQGNSHAIAADGSILYAGKWKLVRLYRP